MKETEEKTIKQIEYKPEPKLKQAFGEKRIIGLAGIKNSAKTNNICHLIKDFRKTNQKIEIYSFGLPSGLNNFLEKYNVRRLGSLKQLINKKDCILILDEYQLLKLNDRRYKDQLQEFIDFVYHRNVYTLLSSPNIREFNSIIGGVIERWLLKEVRIDQCVNGSQLKKIVDDYKGRYKVLGSVIVPKGEILVINDDEEIVIKCDYEPEADTKKEQPKLF